MQLVRPGLLRLAAAADRPHIERAVPTITGLVDQKHDPGRVLVFVDGRFAFGLSRGQVAELGLVVGDELTPAKQELLEAAVANETAYRRVIRLLARRDHARAELLRKLAERGVPAAQAEWAVARAEREGYLDDARFA